MEETTTIMKVCRNCGERKPISSFYLNKNYLDGHKTICKDCEKKLMKELRATKKVGRPSVSEQKRAAAKKAAANKANRPNLVARNAVDIIEQMEADRQPWILMKYPYTVRGIKDMSGICYEVVIWQTCESDHGYSAFEMDAETARKIIEKYKCTERKRYKEEGAIIWAKNDKLQELHQRYVKACDRLKAKAKAARDLYYLLGDCHDMFTDKEFKKLRDRAADAEQDIIEKRNKYMAEYPAKNGIIIYNL